MKYSYIAKCLLKQVASGFSRPYMVMFETTLMCNMFCEYCIFGEEGKFNDLQTRAERDRIFRRIDMLEELEHARARGAKIHAELAGYGLSSDASHITQPSVDGPARAVRMALDEARTNPQEVDYINAHGTGTRLNDAVETRVVKEVFGDHARRLAISSTKSMHGHVMGATGAVELVATVMAIEKGAIPPTANYTEPDPECDLD